MENYRKTARVAATGGIIVLLTLVSAPFFAVPIFAIWVVLLILAFRQDTSEPAEDQTTETWDPQEDENFQERMSRFLKNMGMSEEKVTSTTTYPHETLTPEQQKTLELLAADFKKESDKEFDEPIPLTWDTFNPLRWRKKK